MEHAPIRLMKDRRREMIPIDKIRVINSRTRDESQFSLNVESIDAIGQIKDIRVNDKFLAKDGFYELICGEGRLIAHQRLGRTHIRAEVVTCSRKQPDRAIRSHGSPSDFMRCDQIIPRRKAGTRLFLTSLKISRLVALQPVA